MSPCCGRDFNGSHLEHLALDPYSSRDAPDRGHRNSSKPAPMIPPAGLELALDQERFVTAAVCQPPRPIHRKSCDVAAASSRWKGCGSNSRQNALARSLSMRCCPEPKIWPTAKSSRYRSLHLHQLLNGGVALRDRLDRECDTLPAPCIM